MMLIRISSAHICQLHVNIVKGEKSKKMKLKTVIKENESDQRPKLMKSPSLNYYYVNNYLSKWITFSSIVTKGPCELNQSCSFSFIIFIPLFIWKT